jgi:hypothetical protein
MPTTGAGGAGPEPRPSELLGDGVDEKRGVRRVRLDHRAHGRVAVRPARGERTDGDRVRAPSVDELEHAQHLAEELLGAQLRRRGGGQTHVGTRERRQELDPLVGEVRRDVVGQLAEELLGHRGPAGGATSGDSVDAGHA